MFLILYFSVASAKDLPVETSEQKRLFIGEDNREAINAARLAYLQKSDYILVKPVSKGGTLPKSKPNLPQKIAISSIIITPDNRKIIRVNNSFQALDMNRVKLDYQQTTLNSVTYKIDGKRVVIPVGKTLFPHDKKLVRSQSLNIKTTEQKTSDLSEKLDSLKIISGSK